MPLSPTAQASRTMVAREAAREASVKSARESVWARGPEVAHAGICGRGGVALAILMGAGCAADTEPLPLDNFLEIAAPSAAGSGEAHLASDGADLLLSWLEPVASGNDSEHALRVARLSGESYEWGEARLVASGSDFFVNWADFPSVVPVAPGILAAHWLVRGPEGGYDYAIHIALSSDDGRSWSESWTPHEDATATEHGFVSTFPMEGESMGVIWLDGRDYARAAEEGGDPPPQMALRFRQVRLDAAEFGAAPGSYEEAGDEIVLDSRVCDCCQTSATPVPDGILAVYRDRSMDEVRDISAVRLHQGEWSEPAPVHDDGWVINACPVNGPAIDASGEGAATAWFTGADDEPRVHVAFSADAGDTFGNAIRIDGGNPAGRVGLVLLEDGSALVSWLERAGDGAEVRVRRVAPDGRVGRPRVVASSSASRASGFPQLAIAGDGRVVFAWTDPGEGSTEGHVRVAVADLPAFQ